MTVPPANWFRELADAYNSGDMETALGRFDPEVVFIPDPQWPDQGPFVGRDALGEFLQDFSGAWEQVRIEIDRVEEHGGAAVLSCRWIVRGVASGAPVPTAFSLVLHFGAGQRVTRMAGFFDRDEALRWAESTE